MTRTNFFAVLIVIVAMASFSMPGVNADCVCNAPDGAYSVHRGPCTSSDPWYCKS
ncbi:hypothetical protein BGX24_007985, partial [Mortierella sp. AD032]